MGKLLPFSQQMVEEMTPVFYLLAKVLSVIGRNRPVGEMFTFWSPNVQDGQTFLFNSGAVLLN